MILNKSGAPLRLVFCYPASFVSFMPDLCAGFWATEFPVLDNCPRRSFVTQELSETSQPPLSPCLSRALAPRDLFIWISAFPRSESSRPPRRCATHLSRKVHFFAPPQKAPFTMQQDLLPLSWRFAPFPRSFRSGHLALSYSGFPGTTPPDAMSLA